MQAPIAERGRQRSLIGACILEPVMQGAGGMIMPDPAFQRALVHVCRQQGIPVIFDEVFSGLWRLGTASAAEQLGVQPDIACYAKLLTGTQAPGSGHSGQHALTAIPCSLLKESCRPACNHCKRAGQSSYAQPVCLNSLAKTMLESLHGSIDQHNWRT